MITKDAANEKRYLTKTKNKISKALEREESVYIQYNDTCNKAGLEEAFKQDLQNELQDLNVVDVYILQNDNGFNEAYFAIIEDGEYQFQAARLQNEYDTIVITTHNFLK
jgi:hypothetical protein|nr:MAG TPA: hypothetical protein [Caudoviricetes sp.]